MHNVNVADKKVSRIRSILVNASGKSTVTLSTDELISYLQCLERLAAIERHLYNLTSDGYINE